MTGGKGVDVVYDPVGGSYAEPALRSTAWEGRFLVIGFASGEIPKIPLNLVLLQNRDIVGVFWGEFTRRHPERLRAQIKDLLKWVQEGRLSAHVDAVYPFERAVEAFTAIGARKVKGKVLLKPKV